MFQVKPETQCLMSSPFADYHELPAKPRPIKKNDPNQPGKKIDDYWEAGGTQNKSDKGVSIRCT